MLELNRPQLSVSDGAPLPHRTGHGDFPHPALARVVFAREHSQRHEAQVFQVSVEANALPNAPAALAASVQVLAQAIAHEVIELAKRCSRVTQAKIIGPATQMAVQPPNQLRQRCMALLRTDELP